MSPPRIVLLTNVLAPYRREFFRLLCAVPDAEVHVWFYGERRLADKWRWDPQTGIRGCELPRWYVGRYACNPTLPRALRQLAPQLIVAGGVSPATLLAYRYARTHHVPYLIWWGGTAQSEASVPAWQQALRRRVFSQAAGFLAYSSFAADYLRRHVGVTQPIYTLGNNTLDARAWHERVMRARPTQPPARPIILAVGQLIPRKGYDLALRAVGPLAADLAFDVVLAGEGPEESRLRQWVAQLSLGDRVRFAGYVAHADTVPLYATATVFFHPARRDQWPQVINEALAAALPVLVSDASGVPPDFVVHGHNGFMHRAEDIAGWTSSLRQILTDPSLRQRLAAHALETACQTDVHHALRVFMHAAREVLST